MLRIWRLRLRMLWRHRLAPLALLRRFLRSLLPIGLILATLFFAMSLTPSLVPRPPLLQGLVSGFALAAGYGLAVIGRGLWLYLELPPIRGRMRWAIKGVLALLCVAVAIAFLLQASLWQNSVRGLMGLPEVEGSRPFSVGAIAIAVFLVLLVLARAFGALARLVSGGVRRLLPRRLAGALGALVAFTLFWLVLEGVLLRAVLDGFDASFSQFDALVEPEVDAPADHHRSGGPGSLVAWGDLGRQGRRFVAQAMDRERLQALGLQPDADPIRVYVGLNSAASVAERADLALRELERLGGFQRSVLVVITPTGTGWVDPASMRALETLHRGDVASVAVQYSYLPSWLSLLAQSESGADTARMLFHRVYARWRELPADQRPRLYLHGLSLGALNSERSVDAWDLVGDPIHGALWSGPPFRSRTWQWVTSQRHPDTRAWLPRFRDGSVIRFTDQQDRLADFDAPWGPLRIVYLQYASDPVVFFDPAAFWREPAWLSGPRGADVSPHLRWFPIVTALQLLADIAAADGAPIGHGHSYATEHYMNAWRAVSDPSGWDELEFGRVRRLMGDLPPDDAVHGSFQPH